jgi:hypothetical protein
MAEYITRKKTLMGVRYEIEVPLPQYGDTVVRVHAVPDMQLARIEARVGYKLEDAIAALSSQKLSDEELQAIKENRASPEVLQKGAKALSPELTMFLGELCKAGIVPDPDCKCKGKGCEECDVSSMVEEFKGFTTMAVGIAVISASTADWGSVQDFFSPQKEPSGAGSSA